MKRSVAFYRDTLGLPLKLESPDWTEFNLSGAALALHSEGEQKQAKPGGITFGFFVDHIEEVYEALKAKGVRFVKPPAAEEFGAKLAVFLDPDGYPISLSNYRH
jgi:catechol 2,3-dioxygenase-like lactoylglutathione lyase family enzyme